MKRNKKKFWLIFPFVIAAMGLFIWFFQWLWKNDTDRISIQLVKFQ